MADPVTRGIFDGLVRRAGGVEAVAAIFEARYGTGHKGTVSKMCSGANSVTIDAVEAVEDFVGAFPITIRLYERIGREVVRVGDLRELAAQSAVACGQAHSVLIQAFSESSPGGVRVTAEERAEIIAQVRAAQQVLTDIINAAEAAG